MTFLTLFLLFTLFTQTFAACPAWAFQGLSSNECFQYVVFPTTWAAAEDYCVLINGHLSSILSAFENSLLLNISTLYNLDTSWIGANTLSTPGNWSWSDNYVFGYTNWDQVKLLISNKINLWDIKVLVCM